MSFGDFREIPCVLVGFVIFERQRLARLRGGLPARAVPPSGRAREGLWNRACGAGAKTSAPNAAPCLMNAKTRIPRKRKFSHKNAVQGIAHEKPACRPLLPQKIRASPVLAFSRASFSPGEVRPNAVRLLARAWLFQRQKQQNPKNRVLHEHACSGRTLRIAACLRD